MEIEKALDNKANKRETPMMLKERRKKIFIQNIICKILRLRKKKKDDDDNKKLGENTASESNSTKLFQLEENSISTALQLQNALGSSVRVLAEIQNLTNTSPRILLRGQTITQQPTQHRHAAPHWCAQSPGDEGNGLTPQQYYGWYDLNFIEYPRSSGLIDDRKWVNTAAERKALRPFHTKANLDYSYTTLQCLKMTQKVSFCIKGGEADRAKRFTFFFQVD